MIVELFAHSFRDVVRYRRIADDFDADVAFLCPVGLTQPAAALASRIGDREAATPSDSSSITSARSRAASVTIVTMRRV